MVPLKQGLNLRARFPNHFENNFERDLVKLNEDPHPIEGLRECQFSRKLAPIMTSLQLSEWIDTNFALKDIWIIITSFIQDQVAIAPNQTDFSRNTLGPLTINQIYDYRWIQYYYIYGIEELRIGNTKNLTIFREFNGNYNIALKSDRWERVSLFINLKDVFGINCTGYFVQIPYLKVSDLLDKNIDLDHPELWKSWDLMSSKLVRIMFAMVFDWKSTTSKMVQFDISIDSLYHGLISIGDGKNIRRGGNYWIPGIKTMDQLHESAEKIEKKSTRIVWTKLISEYNTEYGERAFWRARKYKQLQVRIFIEQTERDHIRPIQVLRPEWHQRRGLNEGEKRWFGPPKCIKGCGYRHMAMRGCNGAEETMVQTMARLTNLVENSRMLNPLMVLREDYIMDFMDDVLFNHPTGRIIVNDLIKKYCIRWDLDWNLDEVQDEMTDHNVMVDFTDFKDYLFENVYDDELLWATNQQYSLHKESREQAQLQPKSFNKSPQFPFFIVTKSSEMDEDNDCELVDKENEKTLETVQEKEELSMDTTPTTSTDDQEMTEKENKMEKANEMEQDTESSDELNMNLDLPSEQVLDKVKSMEFDDDDL